MLIYFSFSFLKNPPAPPKLQFPESTVTIIKINNPKIISEFIYQLSFNNEDPKVLKVLAELYQNAQTKSKTNSIPIDIYSPIYFLKVWKYNKFFWFMAGKRNGNFQPNNYIFNRGPLSFYLLNQDDQSSQIIAEIKKEKWFNYNLTTYNATFNYSTLNHGILAKTFDCFLTNHQLIFDFHNKVNSNSLVFNENSGGFHITTFLDSSNVWTNYNPQINPTLKQISSVSLNYYGAELIEQNSSSYLRFNFDLLLKMRKEVDLSDLNSLLKLLFQNNEIQIYENKIKYFDDYYNYRIYSDSTLFIGKSQEVKRTFSNALKIKGNPEAITMVKNLGWRQNLLEFIPIYRITKDFSYSIEQITNESNNQRGVVRIHFKPHINPTLEAFKLFATFVNEASIKQ
jgi:hypothetical protein